MAKGGINGPGEGAVGKQTKDYCDTQRAVYEPDSQEKAIGEFGGVGEYKPLNVLGKADVSKQNPGGGGANYEAGEDEAVETGDSQDGALGVFGGAAAGKKYGSEKKSGFADDVLGVGKGSEYAWNADSPFKG